MVIKTKYDFGDEVYFAYNSKIYKLPIDKIWVVVKKEQMGYISHKEIYGFCIKGNEIEIEKDNVYKTIKELEDKVIKDEK